VDYETWLSKSRQLGARLDAFVTSPVNLPLNSTCLSAAVYDGKSRLTLTFKESGRVYNYDITPSIWEGFVRAPSRGRYFNFVIKGREI
jgi:hypothetical protein